MTRNRPLPATSCDHLHVWTFKLVPSPTAERNFTDAAWCCMCGSVRFWAADDVGAWTAPGFELHDQSSPAGELPIEVSGIEYEPGIVADVEELKSWGKP